MIVYIGDIAESVPCITKQTLSKTVDEIFSENPEVHGIVVVDEEIPISLVTRAHFYQKIGTLYGYNLYMGRSIDLIADKNPLIVDYFSSITDVSKLAMDRKEENRYDDVIVTKENRAVGAVSIQRLLMKSVEVQVEFASFLNPLSRLPGNHMIDRKLIDVINQEAFSILYFDLDNFKAYNDMYGFKKGDELLLSLANILNKVFAHNGFLGHIGGDDFIAVLDDYNFSSICESILREFNQIVKRFYREEHLSQQYVITENRKGLIEKISLVSLSIAVVTNQMKSYSSVEELVEYATVVKKSCKKINGSCCLINV